MTVLMAIFPPARRGAAFGVTGAVIGVSTLAGPTLGGLIVVSTRSGPFYSGQHHLRRSRFELIWRP